MQETNPFCSRAEVKSFQVWNSSCSILTGALCEESLSNIMFKTQQCSFLWHFQRSGSLVGIQVWSKLWKNEFVYCNWSISSTIQEELPRGSSGFLLPSLLSPTIAMETGLFFTSCKGTGACCATAARWKRPNKHLYTRLTKHKNTNIKVAIFSTVISRQKLYWNPAVFWKSNCHRCLPYFTNCKGIWQSTKAWKLICIYDFY